MRWNSLAPSAEKKTKRLDPGPLGRPQEACGGEPVQLLDPCVGLVADRRREVDHRVRSAQRLALEMAVAQAGQVAERDLHVDPMAAEAARIAHQRPHVVARLQQEWKQRPAHGSARPGQQDHRRWTLPTHRRLPSGTSH